jgi:hypothetical protein
MIERVLTAPRLLGPSAQVASAFSSTSSRPAVTPAIVGDAGMPE